MHTKAHKRPANRPGDRHRLPYAIRVRAEPEERRVWQEAARRQGLTVQAWAARALAQALDVDPP